MHKTCERCRNRPACDHGPGCISAPRPRAVEGEHAIVELREEMPAAPPTRGETSNKLSTEPSVADWPDALLGPGQTLVALGNGLFRLRWPDHHNGATTFHDAHGDKAAINILIRSLRSLRSLRCATPAVRDITLPNGDVRHNVGSDNLSDEDRAAMALTEEQVAALNADAAREPVLGKFSTEPSHAETLRTAVMGPTSAADILDSMADTFRERNKVYGSNYKMVAPLVRTLFPNGVPPELVVTDKWHLFELALVKLSRFAISNLTHEDSIHDMGVYCAMVEQCINEEKEAQQ